MSEIGEWIEQLEGLEEAIDRLIDIAKEKRDVVVKGNVSRLETLVREETGLLKRMSLLEDQRQRSTVMFALRTGLNPKTATLSTLLEVLPQDDTKERLSRLRNELRGKMEELSRLNGINEELLITQRDLAHFMLEGATRPT